RNPLFNSLLALGAAGCVQAADDAGPRLVNINGSQEVVYGSSSRPDGKAAGGEDRIYAGAPGGRTQAGTGLVGRMVNVSDDDEVVYAPAAPAASAGSFAARR
ncbi:MAG TPA: hypothetical protein VE650_02495, partial [Acetobacteraceae bacterium]|nr:hypothetical protein [Acetobacteraceae bacterium]